MCQDETKTIPGSLLVGIALAFGAMFGMAAQAALQYVGLDLAGMRDDLMIGVTQPRSALIWSIWWLLAIAALFVGPFGVVLARRLAASRWLFRSAGLLAAIALVVGFAKLGYLVPSGFGITLDATADWPVVALSALLAALGARLAGATKRERNHPPGTRNRRHPVLALAASPRLLGGGGSVNSGLPSRRHGRSLVPGWRAAVRLAFMATLAIVVVAAVSAVSGAAVVGELIGPGAIRDLARQATRAYAPMRATRGADPRVVAAAVRHKSVRAARLRARPAPVRIAPPPPVRIAAPPPPARITAPPLPVRIAALPAAGVPMSASELTFAKGYALRRAARDTARTGASPTTPEIRLPAKLTAVALRIERADRHRHKADGRHGGSKRHAAYNQSAGGHLHAGHSRQRAHDGYGVYPHYAGDDGR
jgi:hypothetical protein